MNASYVEVRRTVRILREFGYRYQSNQLFRKNIDRMVDGKVLSVTNAFSLTQALYAGNLDELLTEEHRRMEESLLHRERKLKEQETNKNTRSFVVRGPGETDDSLEEMKRFLSGKSTPQEPHLKLVEDPKVNDDHTTSGDND